MSRIEFDDGSEVFTRDEVPTKPEKRDRLHEMLRRRRHELVAKTEGLTTRQRTESALKRIVKGMWNYASGDGDDFDRALRMIDGEPEPETVLPDDD